MKDKKLGYTVFFLLILILGFSIGVFFSPISINWIQINNEDIFLKSSDSNPTFEDLYNVDINVTWGGVNRDEGTKIKLYQSGIFISGRTKSIGAGDFDAVLIKMDESGNEQWNTTWGGTEIDYSGYIDFDSSNNIFLGGNTDSFGPSAPNPNWLLIKYDNSGAQLWNRTWGTAEGEWGGKIVVDSQDNVYYAGTTWGHIASSGYIALVKHNNAGIEAWTEYWGSGNRNHATGITIDSLDNIYITGYGGNTVDQDVCLLKYTSSGSLVMTRLWGGSGIDRGYGIQVDSLGNIYIAGITESFGVNTDALLLKYNSSGDLQWSRIWGGSQFDAAYPIALDSSNNIYIAGDTESFGDLNGDSFIVKYNSEGDEIWNYTWGGNNQNGIRDMIIDSSDNIYVTGLTENYGAGDADIILLKFSPIEIEFPEITINSPVDDQFFGATAPNYDLSINGSYETIWYTLDNGITNITASGPTGTIDQAEWDKLTGGPVTITFYTNNSYGYIGSAQVQVIKLPEITINSPVDDQFFGATAPNYDLSINGSYETIWYTLDNGITNITASGPTGTIDQAEWDKLTGGPVTITFYTNNSYGYIGSAQVQVIKLPEITINSPVDDQFFGATAPNYDLSINGSYETIWYTLDNGITNITSSGPTGIIDQAEWDKLTDGPVTITFYTNNSYGYIGSAQVQVIKHVTEGNGKPEISGYNLIVIISITCVIILLILKRRIN